MTLMKSVDSAATHPRRMAGMALAVLLIASLSGCSSSYDCTSPEVEDLFVEILQEGATEDPVIDLLAGVTLENIVTESINSDVNTYACSGDLVLRAGRGDDIVRRVHYGVQPLQNSDDDFQLTYDERALLGIKIGAALKAQSR